jgi:pimeloyl-ACP methyl ester carboxylesterase
MQAAPAGAPPIRHESVTANGLRFHVASCGEGDHLALLLHGFPECWYSWRHQLPLLAQLGYRAWAPDTRGHGASEGGSRVEDYALEHLLDDTAALIDASGARSVTLIAHDIGGIIAWYFAMRKLRPLERLVVMNLPHPFAAERAFRSWKQRRMSWYVLAFQLPWLPEALLGAGDCRAVGRMMRETSVHPERFSDADLQVYRDAARPASVRRAMIHVYRALVRGGGLARQRALGPVVLDVPTLLVWGVQDVALSFETTEGTEAFVRDLTFRPLADASHWVQQDAPEAVNEILREWLTRPRAGATGGET